MRLIRLGPLVFLTTLLVTTSCGGKDADIAQPKQPATVTVTAPPLTTTPDKSASPASPSASAATKIRVPNVVGMNHQEAQNLMQDAGLFMLHEEDATGQKRLLIWDRNWEVVRQSPKPGTDVPPDTEITLYSKKIDE